jgi:biotin synthase
MNRSEILLWLKEEGESRLEELWHQADTVRRENVGDEVHLRRLIEISTMRPAMWLLWLEGW